jgi:MYXO-CTERM domain-containing protein
VKLFICLLLAATAASGATITSLTYIAGGCVTTTPDICAPIGVTLAGSVANPFLNETNTKAIDLSEGSYYTFNEPFFGTGSPLIVTIGLSDSTTLFQTVVVPDTSVAGNTGVHFTGAADILITTTGLAADRMSLGYAPGAFNPSGANDTVFQLAYSEGSSSVPEPATLLMPLVGLATLALVRRRSAPRLQ